MDNILKRYCKFKITIDLIKEKPNIVKLVMSKMIILNTEHNAFDCIIIYNALSDLFDVIKEGEAIPTYEIILNFDKNTNYEISAKRLT